MCGGDMYKEDREKYAEGALAEGMAALVVDAPGTGQTSFLHAPESVIAWQAALDALAARPEIDGNRLGAFGVSRGGLWVMRLAAHDPRVKALISCAPGGVGYWGTAEERAEWRKAAAERAKKNWFGPRGTKPVTKDITEEEQRKEFLRWSLKDNGLLEKLTMPMFLVNGKIDHLTPIGNLYSRWKAARRPAAWRASIPTTATSRPRTNASGGLRRGSGCAKNLRADR